MRFFVATNTTSHNFLERNAEVDKKGYQGQKQEVQASKIIIWLGVFGKQNGQHNLFHFSCSIIVNLLEIRFEFQVNLTRFYNFMIRMFFIVTRIQFFDRDKHTPVKHEHNKSRHCIKNNKNRIVVRYLVISTARFIVLSPQIYSGLLITLRLAIFRDLRFAMRKTEVVGGWNRIRNLRQANSKYRHSTMMVK